MQLQSKITLSTMTFAKKMFVKIGLTLLLFGLSLAGFAQNRNSNQSRPGVSNLGTHILNDDLRGSAQGHYPGSPTWSPFSDPETNFTAINDAVRRESEQSDTYQEPVERQRIRAAQEEALRSGTQYGSQAG